MNAEIIAIGDEITSGQKLDTNSQWLSRNLEELGIRTLFHTTVGDELNPCVDVFRIAIDRADIVLVTGGLGPTADDLTRDALALAAGRPLQLDPAALDGIQKMFAKRSWPMPEQNRLQAMFPVGSRVVPNPCGTAPGIDLEASRPGKSPCRIICLPGVPAEMVAMWDDSVAKSIRDFAQLARRVIVRRCIHCFGAGESQIESMLPDLVRRGRQPTVGITASNAKITLRIAAEGDTEEECRAAIDPTVATIRQCLGSLVFGEDDDDLQHVVVRQLREMKKTLATAECGDGGLMAEWLSCVDNVEDVYRGGLVSIAIAESVETMAVRCRESMQADFGLAVALSHPSQHDSSNDDLTQAAVFCAVASEDGVKRKDLPVRWRPALSRIYAARSALNFMRLFLLSKQQFHKEGNTVEIINAK